MSRVRQYTLESIRAHNQAVGRFFFSPDTLRAFRSRILDGVHIGPGGVYFCTSERKPDGSRVYSVRSYNPETGHVSTVTGGSHLATAREAKRVAVARAALGWPLFWHPNYGWVPRNAAHVYDEKNVDLGPAYEPQQMPKGGVWRRADKRRPGWVIRRGVK